MEIQTTVSISRLAGLLSQVPYFGVLDACQLESLAAQLVRRLFQAGEIIFLEDEVSQGLWLVEEGAVKVYKLNPEGREHILHLRGPGDWFNDIPALDGGPNPASAAALTNTFACLLPADALAEAIRSNPALAQAMIKQLAWRVRSMVRQIEDLALCSVPARLARFLLSQSENGSADAPGVTRAAIASHLATTPETVSRALRLLEDAGAIRFDRQHIVIVCEKLLRQLAIL